ncbi:Major facilitator superfamily domain, general substrate transporter [Niveomyces insectorum RCEF 264]|uniref:Lysosomal dipeptide transporter MFSD1 n=1 Tax=Niveomyces insectorum RCEF 264 TaxID=1081102 RepID=A0A167XRM8_9HYPO|nr:Major facilitator superfamily domain, general substrate transporter [Niveomyces insectorum RCEF 264]
MSSEKSSPDAVVVVAAATAADDDHGSNPPAEDKKGAIPLSMKILSVVVVSMIGFGGHWSSGVTGALKSTLKKKLHISNKQYAVLDSSENFIKTALILVSGVLTDRYGGASTMLWGNAIFTAGSILVAAATTPAVRSYRFMIAGIVVQALGDVATQVAQYKIFSSWFPPSSGFASTLAFELGLGKIGSFVGTATANVISRNLGDFSWAYWMAVFMNLFTNVATLFFWWFTRWCDRRYSGTRDPATGEQLTEKNRRFEIGKMLRLPWSFWLVCLFSLFQTSTAGVFSSNATEFAEQRFDIDDVKAGWYSALSQYLGFFFVPFVGIFIDVVGLRLYVMLVCGLGMLLSMCLAAWGPSVAGTAASFGIYAIASSMGPTVIIDSIRTSMWYQEVFGSGYAMKIAINNSMTIIVRVVAGAIQDHDNNSYNNVAILYVFLAAGSAVVAGSMVLIGYFHQTLGILQWSRKKRVANGHVINACKAAFETGRTAALSKRFGLINVLAVIALVLAAWGIYFWGVATGNNS